MDYQQPPQQNGPQDPGMGTNPNPSPQQGGYPNQSPGGYPPPPPPQYPGGYPPPQGPQPGKNQAVGALVCGIASAVLGLFFSYFSFPALLGIGLGIVGIVLAVQARKILPMGQAGMATAGLVLSIIGLIWNSVTFVVCTVCICTGAGALGTLNSLM